MFPDQLHIFLKIKRFEHIGSIFLPAQVHADRIQSDLEEQVKALNERCKTYGLRAKPTSLVELPFGIYYLSQ